VKKLGGEEIFKKPSTENEIATKVSFQISREIAAAAGKFFIEGEFVKKCMLIAVSGLRPERRVYLRMSVYHV
jgi:hypothetical protein